MELRIDNTLRTCAVTCLRKLYWEHRRNLRGRYGSSALRYGIVWHAAMDAFYSHIRDHGWTRDGKALHAAIISANLEWEDYSAQQSFYDDYRNLPNLLNCLMQYMSHYAQDEGMLKIIDSEKSFELPIEPETKDEEYLFDRMPGARITFTGIRDLIIELQGSPWISDHKTTGKNIGYVSKQLRRAAQFMGYTYADTVLTGEPHGFLVSIHHLSATKSKVTGLYGKLKIDFDRVPEIYTSFDISQWRLNLISKAIEIYQAERTGIWPMQHDSCFNYGTCPYFDLCNQQKNYLDDVYTDEYVTVPHWDVVKVTKERQERRAKQLLALETKETNNA